MDWNLATIWESVCDSLPERVALVQGDRRRRWREFDDRAARLAQALADAGLGHDSKVASYLYNGNEYLEGLYATFKLRGVPVNVNYRYLEDELVYLLDNSDAEAVLFHASLGERVANVRGRAPKVKVFI
ncbi:MAG: AMP-binding protein [Candidatus Rokubacteria bacterium]|nr:AMP-binding protein [Candidatus Rokubacteria bacterium]